MVVSLKALASHTFAFVCMGGFGNYILFAACRNEGIHYEHSKDNRAYFQEHNLQ